MKWLMLMTCLPGMLCAQELRFEFQADAFPASINGAPIGQPWAGGIDYLTPTFCDLDNDGDLDLFCGDSRSWIDYFKNIGNATAPNFQFITAFFDSLLCYRPMVWCYSNINFADLDGDGLQDALLAGLAYNYLLLYHNNGTSSQPLFYPPADTLRDTEGNIMIDADRVALADIDADGLVDLFVGRYAGYIRYYHNIGTSTSPAFQLVSNNWFDIYSGQGQLDPCFGDLDGDGDLDLLIGTGQGHVIYYLNDGTPQNPQMTFVTNDYLNIAVQKYASPELADIDGDGDLDLFNGRSSSEDQNPAQGDLFFYRNDGTAQSPNFRFITSNYLAWDCGYVSGPRLVDVNGDGLPDLISRLGSHLILYRNIGDPGYPNFVYESSSFGNINIIDIMPWFVDVNGDGLLDLFAGTSAIPGPPTLKLFLNQGTPQIPNWVLYSNDLVPGVFNTYSVILSPWTGDIDDDGDQDLFVTDDNGYLYLFSNVGTPTNFQFQYVTNNWQNLNLTYPLVYRFGCLYDIDGDGDLDLFINHDDAYWSPFEKNLQFYRNVGTPQNAQMVLENEDLFPEFMIWQAAPFVIDMDQDGDGDLFVGDAWGGIRYFKNVTGDTTQVAPPPVQRHPQAGLQISLGPNPANPLVAASFELQVASNLSLDIFDIFGRRIATLTSGFHLPGEYRYVWDAGKNASGIYIIRLETPHQSLSEKLTIVK